MVADQADSLHHYLTMKVECPYCQTVFKLTEEQLEVADGMVRCGMCHDVFNALHNIDKPFDDDNEPKVAPVETAIENLTSSLSDKNETLSDEPVKELSQALNNLTDAQAKEPDVEAPQVNEKPKVNDDFFDDVQSKLIPDEYRIPELQTPYSVWKDISWSLAILLLTVSLFVEYAWFNRNELVKNPQLKPWVTKICNFANCESMDLRYPKEIEMVSRNIYSHPNVSNALMVSLTMVNHATFAQPFPKVKIAFSDVRGSVVASRTFLPEEYLQLKKKSLRLLPPEALTDISMEIQDPGPSAMTYEFNFL
jgi:predicted Zn finger-like uncharacterized protein